MATTYKANLPKIKDARILRKEISNALSRASKRLISNQFAKEQDPYGKKWAPKIVSNGKKILIDTGKMRRAFRYFAKLRTVTITNNIFYSTFHQTGTKKMAQRMIFPLKNKTSITWTKAFNKASIKELNKFFKDIK
jgi:phage gpG-like protein